MLSPSIAVRALVVPAVLLSIASALPAAQRRIAREAPPSNTASATNVSAELIRGRLNPVQSRPGDQVTLQLKQDIRSNGQIVIKKGTFINGVVRSVKRVDGESTAGGQAAMVEVEWLVSQAQGQRSPQVIIAVQQFSQVRSASQSAAEVRYGEPGLSPNLQGSELAVPVSSRASGLSNTALMSMPSVVAADPETTKMLAGTFGIPSTGTQFFELGRGEVVSAAGAKEYVTIYSRLSNDTVLTSASKAFEISTGAQLHLLVGVRKN
jgi:hypothetical protein